MEYYNDILKVVKDESVARGVVQTMMLTGLPWENIVKSMGFKITKE